MTRAQPRGMGIQDAAFYCGVSIPTFRRHGPRPIKIGRRCIYDLAALDRWLDRLGGHAPSENDDEARALEAFSNGTSGAAIRP